jgi:peptide-methionine (S)-S-oxide reductase
LCFTEKNEMKKLITMAIAGLSLTAYVSCAQKRSDYTNDKNKNQPTMINTNTKTDTATFGAGCFWCVEAQFQLLDGVLSVESGFSGGTVKNPAYREVCNGTTGHAEVCRIVYDTDKLTFAQLLEAFWQTHDPTQLNRQGNDVGTQYRSVIFYHNQEQKEQAEHYKNELNKSGAWPKPIVTEISPAAPFYKAENYHQNYFNQNGSESYCAYVIQPKVEKFKKVFKDKLKH